MEATFFNLTLFLNAKIINKLLLKLTFRQNIVCQQNLMR